MLTAANYFLGGKALLYPAFVYSAAWTLALFCLLVAGDMFYSISAETLAIFMYGALAFTVGCAAGTFFPLSVSSSGQYKPKKIISLFVALLVVAFPFYVYWLLGMVAENPGAFFLGATRESFVELMGMGPEKYTVQYIFFSNLLGFAPMIAVIAWAERKGRMKRALLAVTIAFLYHLLTGARSTIIQLLLSLLCVEWLITRRLKFNTIATVGILILAVFGTLAVLVHNSGGELTTREQISAAFNEFVVYIGGPLVCFDRVVRDPRIVPHTPNAAVFFLETAAKMGMNVDVPSRVSEFVNTGPDNRGNVFTIYFSYMDVGMRLAYFFIAIQAFFLALIYRSAVAGSRIAIVMYAFLFSCIALTTFSDWLMGTINPMLKTFACAWALYAFPLAKARLGRLLAAAVAPGSDMAKSVTL